MIIGPIKNNFFIKYKILVILLGIGISGCAGFPADKTIPPSPQLAKLYAKLLPAAQPLSKEPCDYKLVVVQDDKQINAFTDGHQIVIYTGMLRVANRQEELALILSHEIAHNVMRHIDAKRANSMLGSLLDLAIASQGIDSQGIFRDLGGNMYSQDFEREADYLGLYIMARAGYNIGSAAEIWRKIGKQEQNQIKSHYAATHPGTAERFVLINKVVKEIQRKKQQGQPLVPEGFANRK